MGLLGQFVREARAEGWPEEQGSQQNWLEVVQNYLLYIGRHPSMMVMGNLMELEATRPARRVKWGVGNYCEEGKWLGKEK